MALWDFLKSEKTVPKKPYIKRAKREPRTPEEAKQLAMARLTMDLLTGKKKMDGIDIQQIGFATILRDVAPNGDTGELLATIEILGNKDKRTRFADAWLARVEAGEKPHRRKGKGQDEDEEPVSDFDRYFQMQDLMDEIEDRREERRRHNSNDSPPVGAFERVLDNLTAPNGMLAKLMETGIPLAPMIAAAAKRGMENQSVSRVTVEPSPAFTPYTPPTIQTPGTPRHLALDGAQAELTTPSIPTANGDDMYKSLVKKLLSLFNVNSPPHDAAVSAWEMLSQEIASANVFQRIAFGSAIGAILESPPLAIIDMMQPYKGDAEMRVSIESLESSIPWLEQFLQELQVIWTQASTQSQEQQEQ